MTADMHRLSVAPMMDWTDRHCRAFHRALSSCTRLYTEMVTTGALLHGDRDRFLAFDEGEHPVALQIGGHEPAELAQAARFGEQAGYDEIDLNVGCPSDRVQNGRFGACLMAEPELVRDGVAAMRAAVDIPVTVKCRIGIDEHDGWAHFRGFVDTVAASGCDTFIVHARKAWLTGLSPKENREIPPLVYDFVYRLKAERPDLTVVLNGGVTGLDEVRTHLAAGVDGVMLGRAAYQDPYLLAAADREVFGRDVEVPSRRAVVEAFRPYIEQQLAAGVPLKAMTRHMLGLFNGLRGARAYRRVLSEEGRLPGAGLATLDRALACVADDGAEALAA